ncbi:hypothetical protein ACIRJR_15395 [Streptomyces sp. NPDC102402]|uniref:hypothetical protein n=1 Tax=Streptomyces sp. NPDC102402 TaxID=3366169 RepID=UPI00380FBF0B
MTLPSLGYPAGPVSPRAASRDPAGVSPGKAPYGRAVLIDVEGLMHFDAEWEHVFLRLRFHDRYAALSRPGLDPRRLDLYMLAMRLSLVAGPLRLLDGDFPDREFMRGVAEHNLRETLALLP